MNHFSIWFFLQFPNFQTILFIFSCALWDRKMVGAPLRASLRHSYRWESGALSPALSVICDFFENVIESLVSGRGQRRYHLPCLGFVWQKNIATTMLIKEIFVCQIIATNIFGENVAGLVKPALKSGSNIMKRRHWQNLYYPCCNFCDKKHSNDYICKKCCRNSA